MNKFDGFLRPSACRLALLLLHIGKLIELGVVAETASGRRYHYDLQSPVGQRITELNAEINAIGAGWVGRTE